LPRNLGLFKIPLDFKKNLNKIILEIKGVYDKQKTLLGFVLTNYFAFISGTAGRCRRNGNERNLKCLRSSQWDTGTDCIELSWSRCRS
jgi:hypothetical protein